LIFRTTTAVVAALLLTACRTDAVAPTSARRSEPYRATGISFIDSAETRIRLARFLAENRPSAATTGEMAPLSRQVTGVALAAPWAVAVRADGLVAVTSTVLNSVTFIDAQTKAILGSVPTENFPTSLAFSADGKRLYVGNQFSGTSGGTIDVIDADLRQKLLVIPMPPPSYAVFTVLPSLDGASVYVGAGAVSVYRMDAATFQFSTPTAVSGPVNGMAIDSTGTRLYVSTQSAGTVEELLVPSLTKGAKWTVGGTAQGVQVTRDGSRVVVLNETGFATDIDRATNAQRLIFGMSFGFGLADSPPLQRMFWSSGALAGMYKVPTLTVAGTLNLTGSLRRLAFHNATRTLIAADNGAGVVWFIK